MSLSNRFWRFSDEEPAYGAREFIITRRDLPDAWENRILTDRLSSIVTQTGHGIAYGRGEHDDRVLADASPRTVYVRDDATRRHWTVNGTATKRQPAGWECRHGFGYTTVRSRQSGIDGSVTYFVAPDDSVEIWLIELTNTTKRQRRLSAFPFVRWRLGYVNTPPHNHEVTHRDGVIYARSLFWNADAHRSSLPEFNREWDRVAFLSASPKPVGFDCLPQGFIGSGTEAAPAAVRAGQCTGSFGRGGENVGSLHLRTRVGPGGTARLVVLVGLAEDRAHVRRLVKRYAGVAKARKALATVRRSWDEYLARMRIDLPDADITRFANGWLRYGLQQRYHSRYGVRDTAQDMAALAPFDRESARRRIAALYAAQLACGNSLHDVPHFRFDSHVTVNSDPPLWLPWVTAAYLKETGDWRWLRRKFPFQDGGSATAYDHCVRAIDWILSESGRHGLPLIKCGDWNDAMAGAYEKGVSVWMAEFLYINLLEMAEIARRARRHAHARRFSAEAERLRRTVNRNCWDGKWYIRGFDSDGRAIGSKRRREARIFANAQTWAVLGGLAPKDRAVTALQSVERLMDTPVGIPMMEPAFRKPDAALGEITRFAPYHHHNGGVWNHLNFWVMLAECEIGRTDRALDLWWRIFPPRLARDLERFTAPPYAYGSWTNTPRSRLYGRGDLGCNTGGTGWAWRVLFEGFCGIRPEYDGLRIDPRMPTGWTWAHARRPFRKSMYDITIDNPDGLPAGRASVELDGRVLPDNLIPADGKPARHDVKVVVRDRRS